MRNITLPSPGTFGIGLELRNVTARAISNVEIVAGKTPGGKTQSAAQLGAFFTAAAAALTDISDVTVPTVSSAQTPNLAPTTIVITFSEALDPTVTPAASAFTASGGKTVTGVAVASDGLTATVTVNTAYVNGNTITVSYTKPATSYLRDRAGNALATFAAQAVTNNVA